MCGTLFLPLPSPTNLSDLSFWTLQGTVRQLFQGKIRDMINHPQFQTDVVRPLQIERLMDQEVQYLSGGELQRVALILCLGKPVRALFYLFLFCCFVLV